MNRQRGFSLVELMVVVAVIAVLGAISVPNMVTGIPKYRVKAAGRDLCSKLRRARSIAVKEQRNVQVIFHEDTGRYVVDGAFFPITSSLARYYGSGVSYGFGSATESAASGGGGLPSDPVTFNGSTPTVTFNSRGIGNAGSVYLSNNRGDAYCVVVSSSGRVRLRRWTGGQWYPPD